ncbi:uncharacterized protein LOC124535915 [Vanessa cardui]|uniref:uncharacterized protein LOC124535915 n=1 Tax=Vanessa cardui TaxID=171605 RepID=UPI001F140FE5|nr:uncharacterized protein LOC124535915 [Vanessa cardui]
MCINIEVILPTIEKFLMLYPLRCGCILIHLWTTLRAGFCMVFYSTAILEVLIGAETPFGAWLVTEKPVTDKLYLIYYTLLVLLLSETVLLIFLWHLAIGLHCLNLYLIQHYLVCRFLTWLIEMGGLFILCLAHKLLIGWYLGILFFVSKYLVSLFLITK